MTIRNEKNRRVSRSINIISKAKYHLVYLMVSTGCDILWTNATKYYDGISILIAIDKAEAKNWLKNNHNMNIKTRQRLSTLRETSPNILGSTEMPSPTPHAVFIRHRAFQIFTCFNWWRMTYLNSTPLHVNKRKIVTIHGYRQRTKPFSNVAFVDWQGKWKR